MAIQLRPTIGFIASVLSLGVLSAAHTEGSARAAGSVLLTSAAGCGVAALMLFLITTGRLAWRREQGRSPVDTSI